VTDWAARTDIEALVGEARVLWERARSVSESKRVEVYLKRAQRHRIGRDPISGALLRSDAIETGTACRVQSAAGAGLAHVAITGSDGASLSRALLGASPSLAADIRSLAMGGAFPSERIERETHDMDLDEEALRSGLADRPALAWVEAGVTVEVLIGVEAWVAVRTRARSSALAGDRPRLFARRGFGVLDTIPAVDEPPERTAPMETLALEPGAAAPVVASLVQAVHTSEAFIGSPTGPGWSVADDPGCPDGLAGGEFDDAGFPTSRRVLADGRHVSASLDGPGSYWRRSFRDAPRALPSTIVLSGASPTVREMRGLTACRLLPLGAEDWVVELPGTRPGYLRTSPARLLQGCRGTFGAAVPTADGVITPGLIFEGIAGS
jgi:hypothetical protein